MPASKALEISIPFANFHVLCYGYLSSTTISLVNTNGFFSSTTSAASLIFDSSVGAPAVAFKSIWLKGVGAWSALGAAVTAASV